MIFSMISRNEIKAFFSKAYGYNTITDSSGTYIFSLRKKGFGFIYLRPKKVYWSPMLYLWLWFDKEILNDPLPLTWAKFQLHTQINRTIQKRKQSKSK